MSSIIREVDAAARLGGDEFAVLLSGSDPGAAVAVGDRIRNAVADGNAPDGMTISIGIVELPARGAVDESVALACADRAMYRAKEEGGNRVSLADLADVAGPADPAPRVPAQDLRVPI